MKQPACPPDECAFAFEPYGEISPPAITTDAGEYGPGASKNTFIAASR